jgi:predicted DNA-binding transcriptional regulator AlpA
MPDAPKTPRRLVQFRAFCAALDISTATAWRWVAAGRLKRPMAIGHKLRVYEAEYLDEVVAAIKAEQEVVG